MMSFPREEGGPVAALVKRKTHEMIFGSVTFHIFRDRRGGRGREETAQPPTMRSQSSTRCS